MEPRIRILVVDDDEFVLRAMRRSLSFGAPPWEVQIVTGGRAGLSAINRGGFDVVISDLDMPEVDGRVVLGAAARVLPMAYRILVTGSSGPLGETFAHLIVLKPNISRVRVAIQTFVSNRT